VNLYPLPALACEVVACYDETTETTHRQIRRVERRGEVALLPRRRKALSLISRAERVRKSGETSRKHITGLRSKPFYLYI
jgi:hypothetical protein